MNKSITIIISIFCICSSFSFASPVWQSKEYGHYSEGEPLRSVLLNFGAAIDLSVNISPNIEGDFSGILKQMSGISFLHAISQRYNLIWFYDGLVLHIYRNDEVKTALVRIKHKTPQILQRSLKNLHVWDDRYPWRVAEGGKLLNISGPPRYVDLMQEVIKTLDVQDELVEGSEYVTRTFKLFHTKAADYTISHRGGTRVIPGVATMLSTLMGGEKINNETQRNTTKVESTESGETFSRTFIQADERRNSVIIYDRLKRMDLYAQLIAEMDQPTEQIEIEVSIIDIKADKLVEIGVEWQFYDGKRSTVGFGAPAAGLESGENGAATLGEEGVLSFLEGDGADFSTILEGGGDYFLTKIRALSDNGDAKVLSQPSVLTQDNLEAVLDHSTSFFVRLEGEDEVALEEITVGSFLQVTPHIIDDYQSNKKVQLDLKIEDGNTTDIQVDGLPTIVKSTISTSATIDESASLLVGGYYYDFQGENQVKVPLLGDIPLLGRLFKKENKTGRKMARMFLITPQIRETSINATSNRTSQSALTEYYKKAEQKEQLIGEMEIFE